jgi:hypothetical protein
LKRLGADGKALLIDVQPDEKLGLPCAIFRVSVSGERACGARDVMNASRVIARKRPSRKLQDLC